MKQVGRLLFLMMILLGACRQPTERLEGYEIHGLDVSHYQEVIDWDAVMMQDIDFVFIKATEGQSMKDHRFKRNWKVLGEKNVRRGAYHFFRPTISAAAQAENYIEFVPLCVGDLAPVLDVEVLDKTNPKTLRKGMKTWLNKVEAAYHIRPIIYTNLNFYEDYLKGHLDDYPLWIARYNNRPPSLSDQQKWHFWQYGNRGQLLGIEGHVDFNVFYGDSTDLAKFCLGSD